MLFTTAVFAFPTPVVMATLTIGFHKAVSTSTRKPADLALTGIATTNLVSETKATVLTGITGISVPIAVGKHTASVVLELITTPSIIHAGPLLIEVVDLAATTIAS